MTRLKYKLNHYHSCLFISGINKIQKLKDNIDPNYVEDPLTRLKAKMEGKNLHFSLKSVSEEKVLKTIKGLKYKKSSGRDEITQEQLKLGAEVLAIPLTRIINNSIAEGKFPEIWKVGVVTPVLKKGNPFDKNNYRPVSCLSVLSKVLEKIVCDQIISLPRQVLFVLLLENALNFKHINDIY